MSPRAAAPQSTVAQYLASLPEERRRELTRVREVISANLPAGYEEASDARMITYHVPLSVYPDTFRSADALALDTIGESGASLPMERRVEIAKKARRGKR